MSVKRDPQSDLVEQVLHYLQRFSDISAAQMQQLMTLCEWRQFDKRTVILAGGAMEEYLNLVVKGLVRKYVKAGKNEVTLQLATEGHLVQSEISFLKRVPSPVIIETLEPVTMLSISYENSQKAFAELSFAEEMARRLLTDMFVKKDLRYYSQLQLSTRERFLDYIQKHPHMLQRVPQKILASYLNIKPETFSRLKHLLKKK